MSDLVDILQERYQALVARKEGGEAGEEFLEDVRIFIADARQAGAAVADLNERSQLRAWMRFLATALYDATGVYPDVTLQPLDRGQLVRPQLERARKPSRSFPLAWMLAGGAAAVVIAAGLSLIGWLSRPPEVAEETPTPVPVPFVSYAAVGAELDSSGAVRMAADTFCLGTPEVVAEFALERITPEMAFRWEVKRGEDVVAAQPAAPWGSEARRVTLRAAISGQEQVRVDFAIVEAAEPEPVPPAFGDVTIALGVEPDGTPILTAPDNRFDWNTKVVYAVFDYVGMSHGLPWAAVWERGGQEVAREESFWDVDADGTEGTHWVTYQDERGRVLPGGNYSVTLYVENIAQRTADFRILYYVPPPP